MIKIEELFVMQSLLICSEQKSDKHSNADAIKECMEELIDVDLVYMTVCEILTILEKLEKSKMVYHLNSGFFGKRSYVLTQKGVNSINFHMKILTESTKNLNKFIENNTSR